LGFEVAEALFFGYGGGGGGAGSGGIGGGEGTLEGGEEVAGAGWGGIWSGGCVGRRTAASWEGEEGFVG